MISDPLTLANVLAKNGRPLVIKDICMKDNISSIKWKMDFLKGSFWIKTRSF
jgi:hypothetical protein